MATSPRDVTLLLERASHGDRQAHEQLFPLVEGELRQIAQARLRRERPDPILQTTILVHDSFLKLVGNRPVSWESRAHFYSFAARVMGQLLVDHARKQKAQKAGRGTSPVPLDDVLAPIDPQGQASATLLDLDEALERLEATDGLLAEIARQRLFLEAEIKEIAANLQMPEATVKKKWLLARACLRRELCPAEGS